jgi:rhamnulokinase
VSDRSHRFLAIDLGAETGRAMVGRLSSGVLTLDEVHRFQNEPVRWNGTLQWDILRLWLEVKRGLAIAAEAPLTSVGVDAWGVDYALLGERGNLLENPYHYRDARNTGMMQAVFERVSREELYAVTGIQFIQINTLYQLFAACRSTPRLIDAAQSLLTIPDLFNYWLSGELASEYTAATTTQFVDAVSRSWATSVLSRIGLPTRLLATIVQPGSVLGTIQSSASDAAAGVPVVAPACHDTASAVVAACAAGPSAFISSGTWSLLGTELAAPVLTAKARDLNFTNEGGVDGTIRLLKNIGGLWLLQSCRRAWSTTGRAYDYSELLEAAADQALAFRAFVDPDHPSFLDPADMPAAIAEYCRQTQQPEPASPPAFVRTILESLAFKYRLVLDALEDVTGTRFDEIRIVGGGSRNSLLNQFTANATGRRVVAGPVEATALGNIAMQMLAAGAVSSVAEARRVIERSFPVQRFEPVAADQWNAQYGRFAEYMECSFA